MRRSTTVMNVITEDKHTFYNDLSLEQNLVSAIITSYEDSRKLLEFEYRETIKREAKISMIFSKNGTVKYYSEAYDMIAYEG
tara:strand:- start:551 stop:796 length:246 start_codon:yes stop_codon:yes gene_type:complete